MKTSPRILAVFVALVTLITLLVSVPGASAQTTGVTQVKVTIDSTAHQTYGLYYPVTYRFQIPVGSSNLTGQYRYNTSDPWISLQTYTPADLFNGVAAARFDYANSIAYLSVPFGATSDNLYLRVLSGQTEVTLQYLGVPAYYDNRKAAVTITLDDWNDDGADEFNTALAILGGYRLHFTGAIVTGQTTGPTWSNIQAAVDSGYVEVASHTRTHACAQEDYQRFDATYGPYAWQIQGSRDDILSHLSLPHPYVPAFIEPCGYTDPQVRQAIVAAGFIADRGWQAPPVQNTFSAWSSDGAYARSMYTYDTWVWPWYAGTLQGMVEANTAFDNVYATGGIYHLVDHPFQQRWFAGSYLVQHAEYISGHKDVWYAGYGEMTLYHYVQERGMVTVSDALTNSPVPIVTPLPTVIGTSTAAPGATNTPTPAGATSTPTPGATNTAAPPATATPTSTAVSSTATPAIDPAAEYSLWGSAIPAREFVYDSNAVELGVQFSASVDGYVTGVRFYKSSANTGTHLGHLWTSTGALLAEATFENETASGWQRVTFANPVAITAGVVYVASYHTSTGFFAMDSQYFNSRYTNGPLYAYGTGEMTVGNGLYRYGASAFPDQAYQASNYWVDVIFRQTVPPASTATATPTSTAVSSTATPAIDPAAEYSLWGSAIPAREFVYDSNAVELGVQFSASVDGYITGVRFYKSSANTGTHLGHLWTSTGALLAEAAFENETASGWQRATFANPVAITAGVVYVASYHTSTGFFAMDSQYFNSRYTNGPLYAYGTGEMTVGNGLYRYGASTFPDQAYQASNYWVDVIFRQTAPSSGITTPTSTSTSTPTPTSTSTSAPTSTNTPTSTPTSTNTPTSTPTQTNTPTSTPTQTRTPTPTNTPTRTPTPALPSAPSSLTATRISGSQISLAWTDNSNNETGFRIERCRGSSCTDFTEIATVTANVRTYSNTGLSVFTTYRYRVRAYNSTGNSTYSNTASAFTF